MKNTDKKDFGARDSPEKEVPVLKILLRAEESINIQYIVVCPRVDATRPRKAYFYDSSDNRSPHSVRELLYIGPGHSKVIRSGR